MENGIQLGEIKGIIRRRRKSFLIVFFAVLIIFAAIALGLPPSYISKATILIESQQITEDYVKSAITSYVEERLELITQQLMSRTKLQEIIDEFGLYNSYKNENNASEIIEMMRDKIKLEMIGADMIDKRTGRESEATVAFTLSYEGENPATVQKVTNKLASLYLEENIRSRTEQVSNTTKFLEQNLAEIQSQVNEIENKISAFKSAHFGELPENSSVNLNAMQQLERTLEQNNTQIMSLRERKIYLEGQLANIDPTTSLVTNDGTSIMTPDERMHYLQTELTSLKAIYKVSHPDIVRIEKTIKELEAEIADTADYKDMAKHLEELQSQRSIMLEKATPQHPDIVKLDKEIQILSDQLKNAETGNITKNILAQEPDNPAYINIKTQIETTEMDIEARLNEEEKIKTQISVYQKRLENSPLLEKEYNNLTRDYENAKDKYNEIMNKLMEARVAQGMEETQRGERFSIIDNAELPIKPNSPNRRAIALIGLVLAIGAGVGMAAVQESLDDSFKTSEELSRFMRVPVLSVMPMILSNEDKRRASIRWAAIAAGTLFIIVLAIVLFHNYVMPMDILLVKIQKRVMGVL